MPKYIARVTGQRIIMLWEGLDRYDPDKGADFLTYVHHHVGNALLPCRMREEGGSFSSLDEYKAVRGIAWLYVAELKRKSQ